MPTVLTTKKNNRVTGDEPPPNDVSIDEELPTAGEEESSYISTIANRSFVDRAKEARNADLEETAILMTTPYKGQFGEGKDYFKHCTDETSDFDILVTAFTKLYYKMESDITPTSSQQQHLIDCKIPLTTMLRLTTGFLKEDEEHKACMQLGESLTCAVILNRLAHTKPSKLFGRIKGAQVDKSPASVFWHCSIQTLGAWWVFVHSNRSV